MKQICLVLLPLLVTSAASVTISPECQPQDKWNGNWQGSKTTFLTLFEDSQLESSKPSPSLTKNLTIFFTFHGQSEKDIILINRFSAEIIKVREANKSTEEVRFYRALGLGWLEFELTFTSTMDLWYNSTKLVSLESYRAIHELTVESSNVTVNCHRMDLEWKVSSSGSAIIPLAEGNREDHVLSFYSNSKAQPILTLSGSSESVRLGWQGSSMVDTTIIQDQAQSPLPAFTEHFVNLSCIYNLDEVICSLVNCKENRKMKTFAQLPFMPKSLMITSENREEFWIFLHRPLPPSSTISPKSLLQLEQSGAEQVPVGFVYIIGALVVICVFLIGGVAFLLFQSKQKNKLMQIIEVTLEDHESERLFNSPASSQSSIIDAGSFASLMDPRMWEAVIDNDARLVEYLLQRGVSPYMAERRRQTSAYVEAHILGRKEILQLISTHREKPPISKKDLIESILYEHERRMKRVFKSAQLGMYAHDQGVKLLLQAHSLPATIKDHKGCSMIHYIASSSFINGRPAWDAKDISDFFQNHEYYIDAIDAWGSTGLHKLATRERLERHHDSVLHWEGQEKTLDDIWLDVAKIFLNYGCDPRITDHRGFLAQDLAKDNGHYELAALLKKECDRLGRINYETAINDFPSLATAAAKGDTAKVIALLRKRVPILPICAHTDPLVEAIRCNQREVLFLLLSAGAPLTNQSIEDLTPLEAAHYTVGLPAFFPALMRKVYSDRLREQQKRITSNDESYQRLSTGMEEYTNQIIKTGCKAKWTFINKDMKEKSKEARKLLTQAAKLGLSLVCQVLSMENVYLHPLYKEEKPFCKAAENRQMYTQSALCRDLKMSPFAFASSTQDSLNVRLREKILDCQFKILQNVLQDQSNLWLQGEIGCEVRQFIKDIRKLGISPEPTIDTEELQDPPHMLLHMIAKTGLDAILHIIANKCKGFDINMVIDFSGSTLLHIASIHGHLNMIEFLIYHGAKLDKSTIGGFTAAHLAALSGHKESFTYIEEYMESKGNDKNQKCNIGLTASELMDNYTKACEQQRLPLISHEDTIHVLNEKGEANQAYEMLKRKGKILSIRNPSDLLRCADQNACQKPHMTDILSITERETRRICENIDNSDFKGELFSAGPLQEENEIFNISDANFILELSKFHCLGYSPTVTYKRVSDDEKCTVTVESKNNAELFNGTTFIQTFSQTLKRSIREYTCPSTDISIAPPFLTTSHKGICFYLILKRSDGYAKIAIHLTPVIAVDFPEGSKLDAMPKELNQRNQNYVHLHLNNNLGEWMHRPFHFENSFFKSLGGDERRVWMTCHLIRKLLSPCSWAPRFNTKRDSKPWHTLSVGVPFHQPRAIKSLFLYELQNKSSYTGEEGLFEWLLAIYRHAAKKDEFGKWIPCSKIHSFVHPNYFLDGKEAVCGILKYLEMLRNDEKRVSLCSLE